MSRYFRPLFVYKNFKHPLPNRRLQCSQSLNPCSKFKVKFFMKSSMIYTSLACPLSVYKKFKHPVPPRRLECSRSWNPCSEEMKSFMKSFTIYMSSLSSECLMFIRTSNNPACGVVAMLQPMFGQCKNEVFSMEKLQNSPSQI